MSTFPGKHDLLLCPRCYSPTLMSLLHAKEALCGHHQREEDMQRETQQYGALPRPPWLAALLAQEEVKPATTKPLFQPSDNDVAALLATLTQQQQQFTLLGERCLRYADCLRTLGRYQRLPGEVLSWAERAVVRLEDIATLCEEMAVVPLQSPDSVPL